MLRQKPSAQQFQSLKPIKQMKLKMFKQISQNQNSTSNILDHDKTSQPRKSFLNVTRRYSVIDCTHYSSFQQIQQLNINHISQYQSKSGSVSTILETNKNFKRGKENIVVNRIPIKIRSKRVNSKKQLLIRQRNKVQSKSSKQYLTKKLLQSPFYDDFICLQRQQVLQNQD